MQSTWNPQPVYTGPIVSFNTIADFVTRGVVKVRKDGTREGPLMGTYDDIRKDFATVAEQGVTELFVDLNFDPEIGSPDADPAASMRRAEAALDAFAPG